MSDIKKTPLEHALDLIQAQKAWIMAVPDDTVLPTMPSFDRERADRLEAFLAEQVAFEKSLNSYPEHDALVAAITMCPHTITTEFVTLEWSGKSPGTNTLNQLTERIKEWKKQFSLPYCVDMRDMPKHEQVALMEELKNKPAAAMKMVPGPAPAGWQPIETAPKDFVTVFDGWNGERVTDVSWAHPEFSPKGHFAWCKNHYVTNCGWSNEEVGGLTHWMPRPDAPISTSGIPEKAQS